jgi:hypothetical protein
MAQNNASASITNGLKVMFGLIVKWFSYTLESYQIKIKNQ